MADLKIVVNGAGAAAISCCKLYVKAGVTQSNIHMYDSKGCIHKGRTDLNKYKIEFAAGTDLGTLGDAMKGADVFIGLSVGGAVKPEMVKLMAPNPILFAMANPDPEIDYEDAVAVRDDLIMATGRSDYPNQVNNVLGFPFIFRGALDVRATAINEEMKMAAVKALAGLAREKVPEMVINAYGGEQFSFGRDYIIPKPFDPRVLWRVAPAVAKAAIETGVAKNIITDWKAYEEELKDRIGMSKEVIRVMIHKAQKNPCTVIYPEGEEEQIIRAAHEVSEDHMAVPVLLGSEEKITNMINKLGFNLEEFRIIDPLTSPAAELYATSFYNKRQRKGMTLREAKRLIKRPIYFGAMMLETGDADSLISGLTTHYPMTIKPALQCVGLKEGYKIVSGMYIVVTKKNVYFFADTTVNVDPNAEQLADIAISAASTVRDFDIEPKLALLSYSNFGSSVAPQTLKVKEAVQIIKQKRPDIIVEGEMQADAAVDGELLEKDFPFSSLKGGANVLIFPDLNSGNIAYKLMGKLGGAQIIGPILMGTKKPVHVLQRGATVDDIINMTAIAVVQAGKRNIPAKPPTEKMEVIY